MVKSLKKKKSLVKDKERTILQYIDAHGGGVTAHEIAQATGISYVTVRKYIAKMVKEGILEDYDD